MFSTEFIEGEDSRPIAKIFDSMHYGGDIPIYLYRMLGSPDLPVGLDPDKAFENISIVDGHISQMPNPFTTDRLYIAGPSGSGKSTYAANYAIHYKGFFPDNKVYLFSRVDKDISIDNSGVPIMRVLIDEALVENPIDIAKDLKDALVIFDDIDTISDKKIKTCLLQLRDDVMQTGRHSNTSCICTGHQITNYKETRTLLNEATSVTIFPRASIAKHVKYYLQNYAGCSTEQYQRLIKLPSRWLTIFNGAPMFVLYESGMEFIR